VLNYLLVIIAGYFFGNRWQSYTGAFLIVFILGMVENPVPSFSAINTMITGNIPSEIKDTAVYYGKQYGVEPAVFLAIAWHERGAYRGWYDDYVFGYGAYDKKPWAKQFSGWKKQWENAAPKIGTFFSGKTPSVENFQAFARDIYKTTAWQSYRSCFKHYRKFGGKQYV
jgi:hypothetical protein